MSMYKRDMYIAYILFSTPRANSLRRNNWSGRHQCHRPLPLWEVTPEQFAVSSYLCGPFVRDQVKFSIFGWYFSRGVAS